MMHDAMQAANGYTVYADSACHVIGYDVLRLKYGSGSDHMDQMILESFISHKFSLPRFARCLPALHY